MASVFLSYDRDDAKRARPIALRLEKAGHSVWWDLHVRGGAQFSKVIEEALKAADVVVVLWSAKSIGSPWVRDEASAGRDSGRLVPVTLDGTEPPLGFRQFQTIDMSRWNGRGTGAELRTLLQDIAGTTEARSSNSQTPVEQPAASTAKKPFTLQRKPLLIGAGALLVLFLAAGFYLKSGANDTQTPTIRITAADNSPLSQSMAQAVLINLGSVGGNSGVNFRLLEEASGVEPDFSVRVGGLEDSGKIQATVALASSKDKAILWSRQIGQLTSQRANLEQALAFAAMAVLACAADESGAASRWLKTGDLRAYLNACVARGEAPDVQPLVATFRATTKAAPRFVPAWANLLLSEAEVLSDQRAQGNSIQPISAALRRDLEAARRIDSTMPAAVVAEIALQPATSFLSSMSLIDEAIAAHPDNAALLTQRSVLLANVGRLYDAFADSERAAQLKPYSPQVRELYIVNLAASGAIEKAWSELAKAKSLWPDVPSVADTDTAINLRYGDFEKTWRASGRPIDGGITGYFKILREPTDANIDAWVNLAKTHKMLRPHRYFILQALGPLNRVDQLYEFLQQWPMEEDLQGQTFVLFRPWTAKVRRDPRFIRLAQRLGLLDYWERSGNWPDFCAEPDMPYDCKKEAARLNA